MERMPPEARQQVARWPPSHAGYGVALVGASAEYFKAEEEARAWLQTCRQQALAAAPPQHRSGT